MMAYKLVTSQKISRLTCSANSSCQRRQVSSSKLFLLPIGTIFAAYHPSSGTGTSAQPSDSSPFRLREHLHLCRCRTGLHKRNKKMSGVPFMCTQSLTHRLHFFFGVSIFSHQKSSHSINLASTFDFANDRCRNTMTPEKESRSLVFGTGKKANIINRT